MTASFDSVPCLTGGYTPRRGVPLPVCDKRDGGGDGRPDAHDERCPPCDISTAMPTNLRFEQPGRRAVALDTGGEARQLTSLAAGAANPEWSPDGRSIALTSRVEPRSTAPAVPDAASKDRAAKERTLTRLTFRTNDEGYAREGFTHIFV